MLSPAENDDPLTLAMVFHGVESDVPLALSLPLVAST
jgi:hypothetical protein